MSSKFLDCENGKKMEPFAEKENTGKEHSCGKIRVQLWTWWDGSSLETSKRQ